MCLERATSVPAAAQSGFRSRPACQLSWRRMLIKHPTDIPASEITPEATYLGRRDFVRRAGAIAAGALVLPRALSACAPGERSDTGEVARQDDRVNSYDEITSYNNYYEFGTDKEDPKANSGQFHPQPWSIQVDGLCDKPGNYHFEDVVRENHVEDRTYRLRCVEAWSMVIPWQGIPMAAMLKRFAPRPAARYVAFTTVMRPSEMPGQRRGVLPWPYIEGLR